MIDHMCLSEYEDGTPAVIHGVPSTQSSRQAFELIIKNNITLQRANDCTELIHLVDISSLECDSKKRTYRVCVITVPQVRMIGACKQFHRQTDFDSQFLSKMKFFGNDDVIPNVDAIILLGDFRLENEALPEKMLLVRLDCDMSNSMLSREEKEEMASNKFFATLI